MAALTWLAPGDPFPATSDTLDDPQGLLAAGADLSPSTLLKAYSAGIFPWYSDDQPILWWAPSPRMILKPSSFHLSRSLRKRLRQNAFSLALDHDFEAVIARCASVARDDQPGTWITQAMQQAYVAMHQLGFAHSIEVYRDGDLVGGLYGIKLGKVFFGESMFSQTSDASKVALFMLCALSETLSIAIIDCQMQTNHLASLGAQTVARETFEQYLPGASQQPIGQSWHKPPQSLASWRGQYKLEW